MSSAPRSRGPAGSSRIAECVTVCVRVFVCVSMRVRACGLRVPHLPQAEKGGRELLEQRSHQ